ncbi:MAG TPA: PQQ-binding-like beta-propeller repeat protein [Candidatus Saccharimonadales bacterium]|nr:PQQ-binding-like beta-propeller repeat protein [Candidatus Saccharimonadales bacterium]
MAPPVVVPAFDTNAPNLWLTIANQTSQVVISLQNTVVGDEYLLFSTTNLNQTWTPQQSLIATGLFTFAQPIEKTDPTSMFFKAQLCAPGTLKWQYSLSNSFNAGVVSSPAIGPDGTIYITSGDNQLCAIDPLTGTNKWSITNVVTYASGYVGPSPSIGADGTVYIGDLNGNFYAIDGSTGGVKQEQNLGGPITGTSAIGVDGTVYASADDTSAGGVMSSLSTNGVNWTFAPKQGPQESSLAIGPDGTIYYNTGTWLVAVSSNGKLKWFFAFESSEPWIEGDFPSSPVIAPDGTIITAGQNYVYWINPDGSLQSLFDTKDSAIASSPAIGPDGTVYVATYAENGTYGGNLYAIANGHTNWVFNSPYPFDSSPAVGADNTIYISSGAQASSGGYFYAVTNGSVMWSYFTEQENTSSPVIGADGTVYFASGNQNLYAFCGSTAPATNAGWPMFQKDAQHHGTQPSSGNATSCGAPFPYDMGESCTANFAGAYGTTWSVYTSGNLTNWSLVTTVTLTNSGAGGTWGDGSFTDVSGTNSPFRQFYVLTDGHGCYSYIFGYEEFITPPGTSYISDPFTQNEDNFDAGGPGPMNTLNGLFPGLRSEPGLGQWTDGSQITAYENGSVVTATADEAEEGWLPNGNGILAPGFTAKVVTSSYATNLFMGTIPTPPLFTVVNPGTNYLSSKLPIPGDLVSDLGFTNASPNDQVWIWNTTAAGYAKFTNIVGSGWTPSDPYLASAQPFVLITTNATIWTQTFSLP